MTFASFQQHTRTQDAVIRNLEVIGEAAKKLPDDLRQKTPGFDWRRVAGLRDILIHAYFAVDIEIVWDVAKHRLQDLEEAALVLRDSL
jgi:uncharacterized protein with HEPN domain